MHRTSSRAGFLLAIITYMMSWPAVADTHMAGNGLLSEMRLGLLYHDASLWVAPSRYAGSIEPSGPDLNTELLFVSPGFLEFAGSPRPHLGVTVNPQGATSQAYLGLTWNLNLTDSLFFELGGGGAIHNGEIDPLKARADERPLGCRVLFRFSFGLGMRFGERHSLLLGFDHISNGFQCDPNPGLDTPGLRYGYHF